MQAGYLTKTAYSTVILSEPAAILHLSPVVRSLLPERDDALEPRFFLASLSSQWAARVVVVRSESGIAGVLYAKERVIAGVPIGIVYADGGIGMMLAARPPERLAVLRTAVEALYAQPRVLGVRLALPDEEFGPEVLEGTALRAQVSLEKADNHARLRLGESFEDFLKSLGYKTRRNFRHYCRESEASGHEFVEQLSTGELESAAMALRTKCKIPTSAEAVHRIVKWVSAAERPLAVGLRRGDEWLSVAAGLHSPGRAVMLLQLNNDTEYNRQSLSVVLRARLIEALIRNGVPELLFWAGTARPLDRYSRLMPATGFYLDSPSAIWRIVRLAAANIGAHLPTQLAKDVNWIAPSVRKRESASPGLKPERDRWFVSGGLLWLTFGDLVLNELGDFISVCQPLA